LVVVAAVHPKLVATTNKTNPHLMITTPFSSGHYKQNYNQPNNLPTDSTKIVLVSLPATTASPTTIAAPMKNQPYTKASTKHTKNQLISKKFASMHNSQPNKPISTQKTSQQT
jgi:hypothetical protein